MKLNTVPMQSIQCIHVQYNAYSSGQSEATY